MDTGSTVTYVPSSSCSHCGDHQARFRRLKLVQYYSSAYPDSRFQPDMSRTYQPVKCSPSCNCDDEKKQCTYDRRYAEMSSSSGVLGEDLVSFGNQSELAPQRAVYYRKCHYLPFLSQRADSIMGLGLERLSVVDQLVDKGVIGDSFSLCYRGMDVDGVAMVLGEITAPDMVFSHSDPFRSPYYNIELKESHVAGKHLKLPAGIFNGKHGIVLDSGTTYAYFRQDAFAAFRNAILSAVQILERIHCPNPNYHDFYFSGAGSDVSQLSKVFPEVEMVFNSGKKFCCLQKTTCSGLLSDMRLLCLSYWHALYHAKVSGAYCLGISPNSESTTLIGEDKVLVVPCVPIVGMSKKGVEIAWSVWMLIPKQCVMGIVEHVFLCHWVLV
ncbi:Eukaryotic aspartyl protease family protein isoform 3 [Hibiscus syriacus]|uniref:Eukaryotic aspartyl protease family protein isoform 3 n=1 Tax=Hibiscus syriacus TaxID=106335 RepID=A0A6A2XL80_HIBSY|nr:Eukaryotic aspartyl protease family protein isoform 3 [Hibiscus syriacus]